MTNSIKGINRGWSGGMLLFLVGVLCWGCQTSPQQREAAMSHMRLGDSLLQEGKPSQALGELLKAQELDPDDPQIHNVLGVVYLEKGMAVQAAEQFQKALALDPKYVEVRNNLGIAYLRSGKIQEAIRELNLAIESPVYTTPQFAYYNLGQAYLALQDYEKARANFSEALKLSPQYSLSYYGLGLTWKAVQNWEQAAEAFKKTIEYAPRFTPGHFELGEVLILVNEKSLARLAFQEVIQLAPDSELAKKAKERLKELK
jgi:type IV pilus biogenesis/stability protein PilW